MPSILDFPRLIVSDSEDRVPIKKDKIKQLLRTFPAGGLCSFYRGGHLHIYN